MNGKRVLKTTHVKPANTPPINTKHSTTANLSQYAGVPGLVSGSSPCAIDFHVGEVLAYSLLKCDTKKGLEEEEEEEGEDNEVGNANAWNGMRNRRNILGSIEVASTKRRDL